MSRDPHQDDKKQQQPKPQAAAGHSAWELNRLSPTGRNFLLEPESRASIVQELQMRLRREQQRREEMLSSQNNAQQDQSAAAGQEDKKEPSVSSADLVATRDAPAPLKYIDTPEPDVTRRNSVQSPTSARGLESEPEVTNQQAIATEGLVSPVVDTDLPQRKNIQPTKFSSNYTMEQALPMTAGRSRTVGQNQESKRADFTGNGSFLPMHRSAHPTTEATSAMESAETIPTASPRRNSVRLAHSTASPSLPAMESAKSVPMASPRRSNIWSETQASAEAPTAAGEDATTQTITDSRSGEKMASQHQSLHTPPCLQCLMRCLQDSGLLGSCWKAAFFALEEAFVIREVADAMIGKSVAVAGGESIQQRLPTQNCQSTSGENSTAESPPQVEVNKWQALERLCHLRKSLRTCWHLSDA